MFRKRDTGALGDLLTVVGLPVTMLLAVQPLNQLAPPMADEDRGAGD